MRLLNKAAILCAEDLKHEDVDVPEWGGAVRVRVMTGTERDAFRTTIAAAGDLPVGRFSVILLASTLIDETGALLFTPEEIDQLAEKSGSSIDKPAVVAMRLNGLGGSSVEDAAKNSVSGQSDDSGSGSPSLSDAQ